MIKRGTFLYSMDSDFRFVTYKYLRQENRGDSKPRHHLSTEGGVDIEVSDYMFSQMSLSKIDILSQIEEKLRIKIEYVHDLMRAHKIKFNPLDTPDVIYVSSPLIKPFLVNMPTRVHRYNKDGLYIDSFETFTEASNALYKHPRGTGNISRAVRTGTKCKGYYWSKEKLKKL